MKGLLCCAMVVRLFVCWLLLAPPPSIALALCLFVLQFLCCLEILLGTVGTAPQTLVDGAAAGLGAVLGEMHRERLFAAGTSAEVSLPLGQSRATAVTGSTYFQPKHHPYHVKRDGADFFIEQRERRKSSLAMLAAPHPE